VYYRKSGTCKTSRVALHLKTGKLHVKGKHKLNSYKVDEALETVYPHSRCCSL